MMEKHLLVNKSNQQGWMSKFSSLFKLVTRSSASLKDTHNNVSRQSATRLGNFGSGVVDFIRKCPAPYTEYEMLSCLLSAFVYTPLDMAKIAAETYHAKLNMLPPLVTMAVFSVLVHFTIQYVRLEYQAFLDLGRGGTPKTPYGWISVSIKKFLAQVDVFERPHFDPIVEPSRGQLSRLTRRPGNRPTIKGVAPQRQLDQKPSPEQTFDRLVQMLKDTARRDDDLTVNKSYLEGHTDALKAICAHRQHEVLDTDSEWNFEIAHPHKIDGSLHMILHPEDVSAVIENRWGERHPLATDAWWWKMLFHRVLGMRRPTPYNLVLIYAPRDESEYVVVQQILDAAVWYHKEKDRSAKY